MNLVFQNALEPCAVHIIPDVLGRAVLENHPAVELLELIGRHALPKEIIIAANESLERFGQSGDLEDASAIELEYLVQLYSAGRSLRPFKIKYRLTWFER